MVEQEAASETRSVGMTRAEAVARARRVAEVVREHAGRGETLRRIPDETARSFVEAGLIRLLTPREFGGHELELDAFVDVAIEIARADASAGWCFSFMNIHSWLLACFPRQAQEDVWTRQPDAGLVNVNVPAGQVTRVEGGYRLSGDWPWASGVHHCDWGMLAGLVHPEAGPGSGPPDAVLFLVPKEDWEIRDTWWVAGQRGTGSHNVVVKDKFVPHHRTARLVDLRDAQSPGGASHGNAMYRQPMIAVLVTSLVAPILGAARGAYERWCAAVRDQLTMYGRERVAALSHQQIRLAEIAAEIDAAELLLRRALDDLRAPGTISLDQRVRIRRDYAYGAVLCVRAVERLYSIGGASANYESNLLQRDWRDIHAMAAHAGLNFDATGENFGRLALGLPLNPNNPMI